MSQLDSMLSRLRKVVDEHESTTLISNSPISDSVDANTSRQALAQFVSNTSLPAPTATQTALTDPRVIDSMKKSLAAFIQAPLSNKGQEFSPTPLEVLKKAEGSHTSHKEHSQGATKLQAPFAPAPGSEIAWSPPCPTCTGRKSDIESGSGPQNAADLKSKQSPKVEPGHYHKSRSGDPFAGSGPTTTTAPPGVGITDGITTNTSTFPPDPSMCSTGVDHNTSCQAVPDRGQTAESQPAQQAPDIEDTTNGEEDSSSTDHSKEAPPDKGQSKSAVRAFFNAFTTRASKATAAPAAEVEAKQQARGAAKHEQKSEKSPVSMAHSIMWFKHIQSVESALLLSDVHFAGTILALLEETAKAVQADSNILVRLKSLEAKILLEHKRYAEAETLLRSTIDGLSLEAAKVVSAAYCWHTLARCYHEQAKAADATEAWQKSIDIANAALGEKDPEAMFFSIPLK